MSDASQTGGNVPAIAQTGQAVAHARSTNVAHLPQGGTQRAPLVDIPEQRSSRRVLAFSFALLVAMPTICVWVFLNSFAVDRFSTEFRVATRSMDTARPEGVGGIMALAGLGTSGASDSQAIVQFLQSRAVIDVIEAQNPGTFDRVFARADLDVLSRIAPNAPIETRQKHWSRFVSAHFEPSLNTITVRVTTFSPGDTQEVSKLLFEQAEAFINEVSRLAREDALFFANQELTKSQERMLAARLALAEFQDAERLLSPEAAASSSLDIIAGLRTQLIQQRLSLTQQRQSLNDDTILVQKSLSAIAILEKQIAQLEEATTSTARGGTDQGRPLSMLILEFERLSHDTEFAEQSHLSARASLEAARLEADRQKIYLTTIVPPGRPEIASYPAPVFSTLIALSLFGAIWVIFVIGFFSVREHT